MNKNPDLTNSLAVCGVIALSVKQAKQVPKKERALSSGYWWLRPVNSDSYDVSDVDPLGRIYSNIKGGYYSNNIHRDTACIRPAILISNLKSLNMGSRRSFIYKGLEWKLYPFTEDGYNVALCKSVIKDADGNRIKTYFRAHCDVDCDRHMAIDEDGNNIWNDDLYNYDRSLLKQVLESWASSNSIVNTPNPIALKREKEKQAELDRIRTQANYRYDPLKHIVEIRTSNNPTDPYVCGSDIYSETAAEDVFKKHLYSKYGIRL